MICMKPLVFSKLLFFTFLFFLISNKSVAASITENLNLAGARGLTVAGDTTQPVITLIGDNPIEIKLEQSFTDPGASASDNHDGTVEVEVSGFVDTSSVGSYTLTYTATDTAGNKATISRTIDVIEFTDKDHGITVSEVSGHTAYYNAVADFNVVLNSQPTGNVIIPVSSTDTTEGIVLNHKAENITQLTFTPDNWNRYQKIIVKGRNPNVMDGQQNYSVVLGPTESVDSNYHGINPMDVAMLGIRLDFAEPDTKRREIMVGIPIDLTVSANYSGNRMSALQFELLSGPAGMTLSPGSGGGYARLNWTPAAADMGKTYSVSVRVTDGSLTDEGSFTLTVASETPLATEVTGQTISIIDPDSNLQGLSMEFTDSAMDMSSVSFSKVDLEAVPKLPTHYPQSTDVFMVRAKSEKEVIIRMPLAQWGLPENANFASHLVSMVSLGGDTHGFYGWLQSFVGSYVNISGKKHLEFKTRGMGNILMYFTIVPQS